MNLLILVGLLLIAITATLWIGGWQLTVFGFEQTGQLFHTVWLRLLLGFILGGLVQVLIPRALIAKWLGPASGMKGIFIGSYIGIIIPGGPYINLPIIASIYRAGAGAGPVIALLTGRALLGLQMLVVWQIPILGVEIPLARYIAGLFLPPIVGLAGRAVFQLITRTPQTPSQSGHNIYQAVQQDGTGDTDAASGKAEKWT